MRDIIWTLIIIWLLYRLVDLFKNSRKKEVVSNEDQPEKNSRRDIDSAIQKHVNNEGEYVDFEEISETNK
jgi:thiosulfate reductase cytochrome b subunit